MAAGEKSPAVTSSPSVKVAIVGGAASSAMLAPFDDPSWQIWTMAFRKDAIPRYDVLFEIHDDRSYAPEGYDQGLVGLNVPLVVGRKFSVRADHVKAFPFAQVEPMMGRYLTSSVAYMIALALLSKAEEIGLYGCDMAVDDDEYFYQRPCVEAWIGYARGKGIKVTIPDASPLAKGERLYGADDHRQEYGPYTEAGFRQIAAEHEMEMKRLEGEIERYQAAWQAHSGAKQVLDKLAKTSRALEAGQDIKELTHALSVHRRSE